MNYCLACLALALPLRLAADHLLLGVRGQRVAVADIFPLCVLRIRILMAPGNKAGDRGAADGATAKKARLAQAWCFAARARVVE